MASGQENTLPEIELPIDLALAFENDGTREELLQLDKGSFFSAVEPAYLDDADLVVFKVHGWEAANDVAGAEALKPIIDRAAGSRPDSVSSLSVARMSDGRQIAFLFLNTKSIDETPECVAKTVFASLAQINPNWNDGSELFDFHFGKC